MRPTPLMTNRWEGWVPVSLGMSQVRYHYKFDFEYNKMGKPGNDTALSHDYTLHIIE